MIDILSNAGEYATIVIQPTPRNQGVYQAMLKQLYLNNFAIINQAELDLQHGFSAITGETGAGKSILVDAVSLLLGARADTRWIGAAGDRADLSMALDLSDIPAATAWLETQLINSQEECLVRRVLLANGRSRAFINGTPVTMAQLSQFGQLCIEIHGQHEHQNLLDSPAQLELLDASGDYAQILHSVAEHHQSWSDAQQQLAQLDAETGSESDGDWLSFQISELNQFALSPEALKQLEAEHDRLSQGESILNSLEQAQNTLDGEHSITAVLNTSLQELRPFASVDPDILQALQMLEEAEINLQEAQQVLQHCQQSLDLDPQHLTTLDKKLSRIHDLARKHRIQPENLAGQLEIYTEKLQQLEQADQTRASLEKERHQADQAWRKAAKQLSAARRKQLEALLQETNLLVRQLGMPDAVLSAEWNKPTSEHPRASGADKLDLQFSANPGQPVRALRKVASGGELSRVSLALKVAAARSASTVSMIFDEVDAGIGGDAANAVGQLLARLASHGQVLCVTHLAQVAAHAQHQINVSKQSDKQSTQVHVIPLERGDRVAEIARMLSGKATKESLQHAEQLLAGTG